MRRSTTDIAPQLTCQADGQRPGVFSRDKLTFSFPPVVSHTRNGDNTWTIWVQVHPRPRNASRMRILPPAIPITAEMRANMLAGAKDPPLMASIHSQVVLTRGESPTSSQKYEPTFVFEGKNIGRANETNVFCQAVREAYSSYLKHLRRAGDSATQLVANAEPDLRSRLSSEASSSSSAPEIHLPTPMLAKVYEEPASLTPTIFIQHKYDGLRAIGSLVSFQGTPQTILYGRRGLLYSGFPRVKEEIARICQLFGGLGSPNARPENRTLYLDGELYRHGMSLQVISGIVRRTDQSEETIAAQNSLNFIIYDVFVGARGTSTADLTPFSARLSIMRAIETHSRELDLQAIRIAETYPIEHCSPEPASCTAQIHSYFEQFLREGYEGAIIRLDAPYEHSPNERHSSRLLKMKPLRDAEFRIVDWTVAEKGRARGALLFICETPGNSGSGGEAKDSAPIRFTVTPTGSIESRKSLAREMARRTGSSPRARTIFDQNWRNRALIVKFEAYSDQGVPLRANR